MILCNTCFPPHFTPLEHEIQSRGLLESADDEGVFRLDADKESLRHLVGKAFVEEPVMKWSSNHFRLESEEDMIDYVRFCNSFAFLEDLDAPNHFQLAEVVGDEVASLVSVQEYDPQQHVQRGAFTKLRNEMHMMWLTLRLLFQFKEKFPPVLLTANGTRTQEKTQKWVDEVDEWHVRHGPASKHWYLHLVGCNPQFQGQGKGRRIMNKLCYLADQMQQDMYLEAGGDFLVGYYTKFGFENKETLELVDPADPSSKCPVHLMVRAARPSR